MSQRRPTEKEFYADIYLDPADEIEACIKCHLPDCIVKHRECGLRILLEKKHNKIIVLK